jgi:hypothetical protein
MMDRDFDTYWTSRDEYTAELYVNGTLRASVLPLASSVTVYEHDGIPEGRFTPMRSLPLFNEAERRLGLPRVEIFLDEDGRPARFDLRRQDEERAAAVREKYPGIHEARMGIESAARCIAYHAQDNELDEWGAAIKGELEQLLELTQTDEGLRSNEARERIEYVQGLIAGARESGSDALAYGAANQGCRAALQCLDHDDALPERQPFWEQGRDGRLTLWKGGEQRAVIDPETRAGVVLNGLEQEGYKFTVPECVSLFEEVERHLGLSRIDDVRDADGDPDPSARSAADREAELARASLTPSQWTRVHVQRAFDFLNQKAVEGGLNHATNEARRHLASALHKIDSPEQEGSYKTRWHIVDARVALMDRGDGSGPYASALMACDRALAPLHHQYRNQVLIEATEADVLLGELSDPATGNVDESHTTTAAAIEGDQSGDWLFRPSRASRASERDRDDGRGNDAEDTGREM